MKKLFATLLMTFIGLLVPSVLFAQPVDRHIQIDYRYPHPPQPAPTGYIYRCFTAMFPVPHEVCEYVRIYTPAPRYRPMPLPPPPRRTYMPPKHQAPPPHHRR